MLIYDDLVTSLSLSLRFRFARSLLSIDFALPQCGVLLDPGVLKLVHVTNDPMPSENKHYITLFMAGTVPAGAEMVNAEPHKCEGWEEYRLEELGGELRGRLFGPLLHLVEDMPESVVQWLKEET